MAETPWEVQELGTELVIHNPETGDVHVLNQTAGFIWKAASRGEDNEAILDGLEKEYPHVGREKLAGDIQDALASLREAGLLEHNK